MSQGGKAPPKFASFRPKPSATVQQSPAPVENAERALHKDEDPRHRRSSSGRSEIRERRRHHGSSHRELTNVRPSSPRSASWSTHVHDDIYIVDRKGDTQNLDYGRLHRYDIPHYRRSGHGGVMGLSTAWKIDRDASDESHVIVGSSLSGARHSLIDRGGVLNSTSILETKSTRLVIPTADEQTFGADLDYLPVGMSKRRRLTPDLTSTQQEPSIRIDNAIEKGTPETSDKEDESDVQSASEDDLSEATVRWDEQVKRRNLELAHRTKSQPSMLEAWMELIDHQKAMLLIGRSSASHKLTTSERRALADIRVSIYEKAIRAVGTNSTSRVQLFLGLMDELSQVLESKKLEERWRDILAEEPKAIGLWIKYLDVAQANFTIFRYEDCRDVYIRSLSIISSSYSDASADALLFVFTRLTFMMRDAGYAEHAFASWQAVIEFYLFRPADLAKSTLDTLIDAFDEFWESEVPRLGEPGARGWLSSQHGEPLEAVLDVPEPINSSSNPFETFHVREVDARERFRHPMRTADDTGDDDPFHIVLFSDMKPVLRSLPLQLPQIHLLQAFLNFLGIPLLPETGGTASFVKWLLLDQFLRSPQQSPRSSARSPQSSQGNELQCGAYCQTTETLFSVAFSSIPSSEDVVWLDRILSAIVQTFPEHDALGELYLAFLLEHGDKLNRNPAKTAKELLKRRPSSLRLYNAYGILEARRGRFDASNRAFSAAISLSKKLPEAAQVDAILLWRTWAWELLRAGDRRAALSLLVSFGDDSPNLGPHEAGDTVALLKARNTLTNAAHASMSTGGCSYAALTYECLALVNYLCSRSVESSLAIYARAKSELQEARQASHPGYEQLLQARVQLIRYHIEHTPSYRPAVVRDVLEDSIMAFPDNAIFRSAYAAVESRFAVEDRLRDIATEALRRERGTQTEDDSVLVQLYSVSREIRRAKRMVGDGLVHVVRNTFEEAVEHKNSKSCPALWNSYLSFELGVGGNSNMKLAKQVFFRGLTRLPWYKAFVLRAFGELSSRMSEDELMKIFEVMEEKDLRLFNNLRDIAAQSRKDL